MEFTVICPHCGTSRQWEMWPRCACGHEFRMVADCAAEPERSQLRAASDRYAGRCFAALIVKTIGCALFLADFVWPVLGCFLATTIGDTIFSIPDSRRHLAWKQAGAIVVIVIAFALLLDSDWSFPEAGTPGRMSIAFGLWLLTAAQLWSRWCALQKDFRCARRHRINL